MKLTLLLFEVPRRCVAPRLGLSVARRGFAALLLAASLLVLHSRPGGAESTIHVDTNNPNADDSGLGTLEVPFKTISKAVKKMSGPGVTILVQPGIYFDEHVTIPRYHGGAPGETLVIRAAAPGVVIDGAGSASHPEWWTQGTGASWFTPRWTSEVYLDGVPIPETSEPIEAMPVPSWRMGPIPTGGEGIYVNIGGGNPGDRSIRLGLGYPHYHAMTLSDAAYYRVEGFEIRHFLNHGIYVRGGNHIVLRDNRLSYNGGDAIQIAFSTTGYTPVSNVMIERNVVEHNWGHGISVEGGFDYIIQDNELVGDTHLPNLDHPPSFRSGIKLDHASRCLVRRNRCRTQGEAGINLLAVVESSLELNLCHSNLGHGFQLNGSRNNTLNRNVVFGNAHDGVSLEGGASQNRIYNNILVDNGLGADHYNLFVADSSGFGFESNDNLIWNSTSDAPIKFLAVRYMTVESFAGSTGNDIRTLSSDPKFADPSAGDFRLRPGSEAIDSGNSGSPGWSSTDFTGLSPLDDPATPNEGLGTVTFSDRGAFEFVPDKLLPVVAREDRFVALSPAFPNPARNGVAFVLNLERPSRVELRVFDMQGRGVWAVSHAVLPAGSTILRWPGISRWGTAAAPGVYVMQLTADGRTFARHCTLVR